MNTMRLIKTEKQLGSFLGILRKRSSGIDNSILSSVKSILDDVRRRGDKALVRYTKKFDRVRVRSLGIGVKEIDNCANRADKEVVKALKVSARRIRLFHEKQKENSWSFDYQGATLGQIIRPIERVGVYVPGGKAAYPSTVLMNVIPAQVAGVREIALCVPTPDGELNPYVMAAIQMLGVREVYRIGGAQAIGAMAFGTRSVRKVDKIVGPGNIYVATAKRMVFGEVDIDMIAGPSEVLVIADKSADPSFVAADMLSQAEHDEFASSVCVTDSGDMAEMILGEIMRQLRHLKRSSIAGKSLINYGAIILVESLVEAAGIANRVAPEHLEIMTKNPRSLLKHIRNAGAIFLGKWTPEPMGDYSAGPNHTLPTGGTARFFSPLGVYDFIKRSSLLDFSEAGFRSLSGFVEKIADVEGLEAHANTVRIRKK
jgi:histidinol dehydrogenase